MVLRRGYSVPERLCTFGIGCALLAAFFPVLTTPTGGTGLPCPLRTLTGVPCPFCGLTTATVALVHGHWAAAAAANPFSYLLATLVVATSPTLLARTAGWLAPASGASPPARRRVGRAVAVAVVASWAFQLHRFGYV